MKQSASHVGQVVLVKSQLAGLAAQTTTAVPPGCPCPAPPQRRATVAHPGDSDAGADGRAEQPSPADRRDRSDWSIEIESIVSRVFMILPPDC